MGELELKIALQQEGEEQIREIWHQSEGIVRKRRQDIQEELDRLLDPLALTKDNTNQKNTGTGLA